MTPHLHREFVEGCFRCDLSRDEVASQQDGHDDDCEVMVKLLSGGDCTCGYDDA